MKNDVLIEKMDHIGNGIGFVDGKIVFVSKTIPGDKVLIEIDKETKKYLKASVKRYFERGLGYTPAFCPYYQKCGGCHLQNMTYEDTLKYKENRVKNILSKVCVNNEVEMVRNDSPLNYRNKIELKIKNGIIGFYKANSHEVVEINQCYIAKTAINDFISDLQKMHINNGDVTIRTNYNDELLVIIKTQDNITLHEQDYPIKKVVGIILNDKCIYGENKFIDVINNNYFEVSYDSFFQVNSNINSKLFQIISEYVQGKTVLDLYCGVGTLSIIASKNAKKVYAIEIIPNAVVNAIKNAKMNNCHNVHFILGSVEDKMDLIKEDIDMVIVDPPRGGLDAKTINSLLQKNPKQIIYISCETQKLSEDLKKLITNYTIKKVYILDMFSYTYHCESIAVLERK